jgi:hypothetical protein
MTLSFAMTYVPNNACYIMMKIVKEVESHVFSQVKKCTLTTVLGKKNLSLVTGTFLSE